MSELKTYTYNGNGKHSAMVDGKRVQLEAGDTVEMTAKEYAAVRDRFDAPAPAPVPKTEPKGGKQKRKPKGGK